MTIPNPAARWPTLDLPYAPPSARTPRWRRFAIAALIGAPVLVVLVVDVTNAVAQAPSAGAVGVALAMLWLAVLARSIMALARIARWLEAACAAGTMAAAAAALGADWLHPLPIAAVVATFVLVAVLRRTTTRTAVPPEPGSDDAEPATRAFAFSETSARPRRAALVVAGCVVFAGAGVVMLMTTGAYGWWYLVASTVWLTGSATWMLRITVDRAGIAVRSLILPGALVRIPLDDVARVDAVLVLSSDWGGTGCLVDGGATSILRGDGAALLVTRTDGTQVVVNAERPDEAAATFAALRARGGAA